MKEEDKEVADKANASETTKEESDTETGNSEEAKSTVEKEEESEVGEDYLEDDKPEIDYKKRYGDSTREYQTLKKESDKTSEALSSLEKLAELNPNIYTEIEKAQKLSGGDKESPTDNSTVQQQIDKAIEPIKKVTQGIEDKERLSKVKVLADFEKKHTDLFSPEATKEEKKEIRQRIGRVANALVETGMPFKKAVGRAYLTINPKAAIQVGKNKAYLEGLDEEQAGFSSQTSTEGAQPTEVKYSKRELEIGQKMGVVTAMLKDKSK